MRADALKAFAPLIFFDVKGGVYTLPLKGGVARQSELLVTFSLPTSTAEETGATITLGVAIGKALDCTVTWKPHAARTASDNGYYEVSASCGNTTQPLRLLPNEQSVELRVFCDWTLVEVYFQGGRVAMTTALLLNESTTLSLLRSDADGLGGASGAADVSNATLWPMKPIMTTPEAVRATPRVYV